MQPLGIPSALWIAVVLGIVPLIARAMQTPPGDVTTWTKIRRPLYAAIALGWAVAFMVLVRIANRLPVTHGSKVIMKHELTRAAALGTGVVYLLLAMGALLPLILDLLENSGFARFVGARHIRATKSGFLTTISVLSICGVGVSSCALGSVISIMGGFGADLKRKILANNAHVVVDATSPNGFDDWQAVVDRVRKAPGVVAASPMISSEVMASVGSNMSGVLLRGIDIDTIGQVIDLPKNVELGKLAWLREPETVASLPWSERKGVDDVEELFLPSNSDTLGTTAGAPSEISLGTVGSAQTTLGMVEAAEDAAKKSLTEHHEPTDPAIEKAGAPDPDEAKTEKPFVAPILPPDRPVYPTIVVGRELAKTLHLRLGSEMTLVSRMGELTPAGVVPRERKFRVAGVFFSGMYEYDATHAYITMDAARDFFDQRDTINAIAVGVVDSEKVDLYRDGIAAAVGRPGLRTRDWREINKSLFSALKLERIATFIVLSLAIIVASFCILCTLLLMVTEKGREIAILKALGASDNAILRVFMVEGMIIGGIGTAFGVATGYAVCFGLSWFGVRIDPAVYYIDRLPIAVNGWDFAAVTAAALLICAISTLYPARAASQLVPLEGLRYE